MKILKINIGATGLITGKTTIQIEGFSDVVRSKIEEPTKIVVEMREKGDKPIKGVDYFTEQDKRDLIDSVQYNADVAPIEIGEIENLF